METDQVWQASCMLPYTCELWVSSNPALSYAVWTYPESLYHRKGKWLIIYTAGTTFFWSFLSKIALFIAITHCVILNYISFPLANYNLPFSKALVIRTVQWTIKEHFDSHRAVRSKAALYRCVLKYCWPNIEDIHTPHCRKNKQTIRERCACFSVLQLKICGATPHFFFYLLMLKCYCISYLLKKNKPS